MESSVELLYQTKFACKNSQLTGVHNLKAHFRFITLLDAHNFTHGQPTSYKPLTRFGSAPKPPNAHSLLLMKCSPTTSLPDATVLHCPLQYPTAHHLFALSLLAQLPRHSVYALLPCVHELYLDLPARGAASALPSFPPCSLSIPASGLSTCAWGLGFSYQQHCLW